MHDPKEALLIPYGQLRTQRLPGAFTRVKEDKGTSSGKGPQKAGTLRAEQMARTISNAWPDDAPESQLGPAVPR